jgi:prepilin-type N-terminal cleavage/methylation domain-containing protein
MKKRGMTLIEMLTAAAVGGVILSLVSAVLVESMRTWKREEREFSSRQSAERFRRDLAGDLRRSLPGGAGYENGAFEVEFTGGYSAEKGFDVYKARYFFLHDEKGAAAARELFQNGEAVSRTVYRGVGRFSVLESGEYPSLFELEVGIEGAEIGFYQSVYAPAGRGAAR